MGIIKLLSDSTINQIAAGEVVERPASVVKELVENSLGAGSDKIIITLEQAGKNLIRITDNGIGMSKEDMELSVQRHTTSKLKEGDLLSIHTFGFRGEALPSIASVSKFLMTSRARGEETANQLKILGGHFAQSKQALHNEGTTIEIRDLFYSTPARLKFMRSDKTELSAIILVVKKLALAHKSVSFKLVHDGKTIFDLQKTDDIKHRITELLSKEFIENSAFVDSGNEEIKITGYTSIPTFNKATSEDQFLFINNRPVKDKVLNAAVKVAYQDYLARDRNAVAVIFITIDPHAVDVNVHPAKTEVRFYDPNMVRGMLIRAIKMGLSNVSHKVSTTIGATALGFFANTHSPRYDNKRVGNPYQQQNMKEDGNSFRHLANLTPSYDSDVAVLDKPMIQTEPFARVESNIAQPMAPAPLSDFPLGAAKAQFHKTYIISQTKDSVIIVDQHAAHERLKYETLKEEMKSSEMPAQRLLIPAVVELPDEHRAELLSQNKESLLKLGLHIEKFGDRSIIVSHVPTVIGDANIENLVKDLADNLLDLGENIALAELIEHVLETYACHYSIRAGRELSVHEMNDLLRQMEATPFSGQCNHGRPTYVELKLQDIEKLFGRR